jgi:hypothetical protein
MTTLDFETLVTMLTGDMLRKCPQNNSEKCTSPRIIIGYVIVKNQRLKNLSTSRKKRETQGSVQLLACIGKNQTLSIFSLKHRGKLRMCYRKEKMTTDTWEKSENHDTGLLK